MIILLIYIYIEMVTTCLSVFPIVCFNESHLQQQHVMMGMDCVLNVNGILVKP